MAKKYRRRANLYIKEHIIEAWRAAHPGEDPSVTALAAWALREGLLTPNARAIRLEWAKNKVRRALHDDFVIDPQGREVKANYAYSVKEYADGEVRQLTFWAGLDAEPEKMEAAVAWHRRSILGNCVQLKTNVDSYNDNNSHGAKIESPDLDFNEDVKEVENPTVYPEERPYGEDEEDDDKPEDDQDEDTETGSLFTK